MKTLITVALFAAGCGYVAGWIKGQFTLSQQVAETLRELEPDVKKRLRFMQRLVQLRTKHMSAVT